MLAATVLGTSIAFLDGTVVGIAQPALGREFHADIAGLEWEFGRTLTGPTAMEFGTDHRPPRLKVTHPVAVLEKNAPTSMAMGKKGGGMYMKRHHRKYMRHHRRYR